MTRNIWHKCRRTPTRSRSTFARFAKKHERRLYGWAVIIWLVPGSIVSWYLRDSVPWVTGMSWSVKGAAWPCCRGSSSTWHLPESGQG